jgi:hypothetical protein
MHLEPITLDFLMASLRRMSLIESLPGTFLDSLWRSFEMNRSRNYGVLIDQFNFLSNPNNGEMVALGHNGSIQYFEQSQ